jgi:methionine sulfoxide reductase catalytic subunit
MLIKRASDIPSSDITSEGLYHNRREFIKTASAVLGIAAAGTIIPGCAPAAGAAAMPVPGKSPYDTTEKVTPIEDITTYNNYYEFGTDKSDPAANSSHFKATPWSVTIAGEAEVTGKFALEDLLKPHPLEERIYRLRCVEAWSMVIPWTGIALADLLKRFKPTSKAKYVAFKTVLRPSEMPGQRYPVLEWPYVEGLRIDEAMHPLAFLAVGLYGKSLPNQNGAPLRLVTPWKYGFKGIKSIVEIRFTEQQPPTAWNISASNEYGFYANVNPNVDHPRWSQARERRIGANLFSSRVPTLMFNGYEKEVASLYRGMDLKKYY